jgi:hypothetical protein
MAVAWPSTLPTFPAKYGEQKQPITIRTQPESGPSKSRRRFTKAITKGSMSFLLTNAQAVILDNFWTTQMQSGAVKVTMLHPWRNTPVDMLIPEAPNFSDDGPLNVSVTFGVEYL